MNFRPATAIAGEVDRIALAATAATVILCLAVSAGIVYLCVKYRAGSPADRSHRLESSWMVELFNASLILTLAVTLFLWASRLYYREFQPPKGALELYVIGKQWMWTFQYPGGPRQINRILVPQGRPVRVLLASDDVIHSFFVPAFRIKQDAVPGRYTSLWFEPSELGSYAVLCSELCGTDHSEMRAQIEVVKPEVFDAWRADNKAPPLSGEAVFKKMSCATCHRDGRIAPALAGLYGKTVELAGGARVVADENYLRRAILEPNREVARGWRAIMPTYRGQLSEEELAALIQFLKREEKVL